jgi:hypothetical protein
MNVTPGRTEIGLAGEVGKSIWVHILCRVRQVCRNV